VVGVENVIRVCDENALQAGSGAGGAVIARATVEVRSGILYATLLIVLAFVPLFALQGVEGRLFAPWAWAYIAAILASLVVAVTLTPALSHFAFAVARQHRRSAPAACAEGALCPRTAAALKAPRIPLLLTAVLLLGALLAAGNCRERSCRVQRAHPDLNLLLRPGVSLDASNDIGRRGRAAGAGRARSGQRRPPQRPCRAGRALRGAALLRAGDCPAAGGRSRPVVVADLRARLSALPATLIFGQPICTG